MLSSVRFLGCLGTFSALFPVKIRIRENFRILGAGKLIGLFVDIFCATYRKLRIRENFRISGVGNSPGYQSDDHNCERRVILSDDGGIFHLHKCLVINAVPLGVVGSLESWRVNDDFNIYRVQVQVHVQVLHSVPVADVEVPLVSLCCTSLPAGAYVCAGAGAGAGSGACAVAGAVLCTCC